MPLGKITTLDGDPGVGKSTILCDLAARVSSGRPMPDGTEGLRGGVVILTAEDDADDTILPRLIAAGADTGNVFLPAVDDALPDVIEAIDELAALIRYTGSRLLIIDPLPTFVGERVNMKGTGSSRSLMPLKQVAREEDCSIVLVRHMNKDSRQGKAVYRGADSISIVGLARSGLVAGRDPEDPDRCVLAATKSNLAAASDAHSISYRITSAIVESGETSRVEWLGEVDFTADEIVAPLSTAREGARDLAADWLREALAAGPVAANDLKSRVRSSGHSWATVKRAKADIGVVSRKQGSGGWEWSLP